MKYHVIWYNENYTFYRGCPSNQELHVFQQFKLVNLTEESIFLYSSDEDMNIIPNTFNCQVKC